MKAARKLTLSGWFYQGIFESARQFLSIIASQTTLIGIVLSLSLLLFLANSASIEHNPRAFSAPLTLNKISKLLGIEFNPLSPNAPNAGSPIANGTNDQIHPAVAYRNFSNEYLVVWEHAFSSTDHDIYAQRVDQDGQLLGSTIPLAFSLAFESNPAVTFNPDSQEYLVTWQYEYSPTDRDIYARRITASGVITGTEIQVAVSGYDEINPDVAYSSDASKYLVTWENNSGGATGWDIYSRRISSDGSLPDFNPTPIDAETANELSPTVVYWDNTIWKGFLVAWHEQGQAPGGYEVKAQLVGGNGSPVGSETYITNTDGDQIEPDTACRQQVCLVAWQDNGAADGWDITGQMISFSGGGIQPNGFNFSIEAQGVNDRLSPQVSANLSSSFNFIVAWEYAYNAVDHDVYARFVQEDGTFPDDSQPVSELITFEGGPALAAVFSDISLIAWEDDRNSATTGIDIYGAEFMTCGTTTDCPQGAYCYYGSCIMDPDLPVYHCSKQGCPPGRWCVQADGSNSVCAEDPNYYCENASDCGPAHCCKDNICVKDIDDPWIPGGTEVGPSCEQGVDATYDCADILCSGARLAWENAGILDQYRCYDTIDNKVFNYCRGEPCFGTACNCDIGESCVDTYTFAAASGKTCFLLQGGSCVSNAIAESVYGIPPTQLLSCGINGCFPGIKVDIGWSSGGSFAYERVVATCGSCGDGTCDLGEYPSNCSQDCSCGDGVCAPEEVGICSTDCGTCGDNICQDWETNSSCAQDCASPRDDAWCDMDEFWVSNGSCGCPDAPYFPGIYAVCGDNYFAGDSTLNPETCDSCASEYVTPTLSSPGMSVAVEFEVLLSERIGGASGPVVDYYSPDIGRSIIYKDGYVYLVGQTYSADFPISDASTHNFDWDGFLVKKDETGSTVFSRYLGNQAGFNQTPITARDLDVDSNGNIWIVGSFHLLKVTPDGSQVISYTNIVSDTEGAYGIRIDTADDIYLVGSQVLGARKLDSSGIQMYENTSLGGTGFDIDVDESGNAYIVGDMGAVKLDNTGGILWTTNLLGTGYGVVEKGDKTYVAGFTASIAFSTTTGAFDQIPDPMGDAFLAVLDSFDGSILYSTLLGGTGYDVARDIAVGENGFVYLTGYAYAADFPITLEAPYKILSGIGDIFLAVFDPRGLGVSDLLFSTFIGGSDPAVSPYLMPDRGLGIALGEGGFVYLTGESGSADFPTTGGSLQGFTDALLIKLRLILHKIFIPLLVK